MIHSHDRSGWFGASDVDYIIDNRSTKSFKDWWTVKLGIKVNNFENRAMNAGTNWEGRILDYIGSAERDKQILIPEIRLRVNLDGNTGKQIDEVKTYRFEKGFKCPIKYVRQVNVQMYAFGSDTAYINAYGLTENDYRNYFAPFDKERLQRIKIERNEDFLNKVFLPNVRELSECLKKGVWPPCK